MSYRNPNANVQQHLRVGNVNIIGYIIMIFKFWIWIYKL